MRSTSRSTARVIVCANITRTTSTATGWRRSSAAWKRPQSFGAHVGDELEPRDVIGPVEAGPRPHLGRRQQPARLIRPDVADGHAGLARQRVDRQLLRHGPHRRSDHLTYVYVPSFCVILMGM